MSRTTIPALTAFLAPVVSPALLLGLVACGEPVAETPDPVVLSAVPVMQEPDLGGAFEPGFDAAFDAPNSSDAVPLPQLSAEGVSTSVPVEEPPLSPSDGGVSEHALTEITLRHGESLFLLADWTGVTSETLAAINGLDVSEPVRAGATLLVPVDDIGFDQLQAQRDDAFARRLDRWIRGRGGLAGVTTHRVRTGDTAWSIAHEEHGLPIWVLAAYNPDVDLDRLRIGDGLQLPVTADTVAELEPADPPELEVDAATPSHAMSEPIVD